MRLTNFELVAVVAIITYISFFSHPPPAFINNVLASSVGKVVVLLLLLHVTVYHSLIIGIFLAIAYIFSVQNVTEYLDPTEQSEKKNVELEAKPVIEKTFKGDTRLPQVPNKRGKAEPKPTSVASVKPAQPTSVEHFASF